MTAYKNIPAGLENTKNMADKTIIHIVEEPRRKELIDICYGIIGCMQQVHNQLGAGLPEYIYQEALATELTTNGFTIHKELEYHPLYRGRQMKAYLKTLSNFRLSARNRLAGCHSCEFRCKP